MLGGVSCTLVIGFGLETDSVKGNLVEVKISAEVVLGEELRLLVVIREGELVKEEPLKSDCNELIPLGVTVDADGVKTMLDAAVEMLSV